MHLSMLSPAIPHLGYTRAKWEFDNIECKIPNPLCTPHCQIPPSSLVDAMDLIFCACQHPPLGQLVGTKSPCIAPIYIAWVGYSAA